MAHHTAERVREHARSKHWGLKQRRASQGEGIDQQATGRAGLVSLGPSGVRDLRSRLPFDGAFFGRVDLREVGGFA
jgi:hypothetical protein